jgi:hypothetical protein
MPYKPSTEDEELYGGPVKPPDKGAAATATETPPNPGEEEHREAESTDEEMAESQNSAVVSNKVLSGPDGAPLKEGDEIVLKIIKNFGDESEVAYSKTKPGEIGASESPMSSDSEIEAMDDKGY